jgi:hypothetical protein
MQLQICLFWAKNSPSTLMRHHPIVPSTFEQLHWPSVCCNIPKHLAMHISQGNRKRGISAAGCALAAGRWCCAHLSHCYEVLHERSCSLSCQQVQQLIPEYVVAGVCPQCDQLEDVLRRHRSYLQQRKYIVK